MTDEERERVAMGQRLAAEFAHPQMGVVTNVPGAYFTIHIAWLPYREVSGRWVDAVSGRGKLKQFAQSLELMAEAEGALE